MTKDSKHTWVGGNWLEALGFKRGFADCVGKTVEHAASFTFQRRRRSKDGDEDEVEYQDVSVVRFTDGTRRILADESWSPLSEPPPPVRPHETWRPDPRCAFMDMGWVSSGLLTPEEVDRVLTEAEAERAAIRSEEDGLLQRQKRAREAADESYRRAYAQAADEDGMATAAQPGEQNWIDAGERYGALFETNRGAAPSRAGGRTFGPPPSDSRFVSVTDEKGHRRLSVSEYRRTVMGKEIPRTPGR